jgi:hypothetical protein
MRPFIVKQLDYDLTPVAGLALVGHHLNRLAPVFKRIDAALPGRTGVANSDILRGYGSRPLDAGCGCGASRWIWACPALNRGC